VITEYFYCPERVNHRNVGGGGISEYGLLDFISRDFEIHVASNMPDEDSAVVKEHFIFHKINLNKIPYAGVINDCIVKAAFKEQGREIIRKISPDFIMAGTILLSAGVHLAKESRISSIGSIRAYENFYDDSLYGSSPLIRKLDTALRSVFFKRQDACAIRDADIVLTNSIFMQEMVRKYFHAGSEVIYPPFVADKFTGIPASKGKVLGFIKPEPSKGLDIVLRIAEQIPDVRILCFGTPPENASAISGKYRNIEFMGWKSEPREIYSRIKILLVPSIWPEPFGRVAVEALSAGVVPIVADRGGLPEAVGYDPELIVPDLFNVKEWISRIEKFLIEPQSYESALRKGKTLIGKFDIFNQGDKFKTILMDKLSQKAVL